MVLVKRVVRIGIREGIRSGVEYKIRCLLNKITNGHLDLGE